MLKRGLFRLTASTMLAVFLALLLAGSFISLVLSRWTREDAHRQQQEFLDQTRALVDAVMGTIERTAFSLAINADVNRAILLPWRADRDFELLIRVNRLLAERVNSTLFLESIILYSPENRKVMADYGVADLELFHDQSLIREAGTVGSSPRWLRTRTVRRSGVDAIDVLSFVIRLPLNQSPGRGFLILNIGEGQLFSTLVDVNESLIGRISILDAEGRVISDADKDRIGKPYGPASVLSRIAGERGSFTGGESGAKTLVTFVRDTSRSWTYIAERDAGQVFAGSRLVFNVTLVISLACLALGLILSFLLSKRSWLPVQEELDRSRDLLREQFVAGLLNGTYIAEIAFRHGCREYDLPMEEGPYQVLIVNAVDPSALIGEDAGDESMLASRLRIRCTLSLGGSLHGTVTVVGTGEIAVILAHPGSDRKGAAAATEAFVARFLEAGDGHDRNGFLFHSGDLHDRYEDIRASYAEARELADSAEAGKDDHLVSAMDIRRERPRRGAMLELERIKERLLASVRNDRKGSAAELQRFLEKAGQAELSAPHRDAAFRSLADGIVLALSDRPEAFARVFDPTRDPFAETSRLRGPDEYAAWIRQAILAAAGNGTAEDGDRAAMTVRRIRAYLDQHYAEQIDLATMAEKVYVSPPYLCRIFKQATGSTYFEQLTSIRVEKAKELLKETLLPIHVVAERTGFLNKRNINRAFNKYLALTPSEYRLACGVENLSKAGEAPSERPGTGAGSGTCD